MKRIIIICEGPTEIEFCKDVLYSSLINKGILIHTPLIKKSGGGIVPWPSLKKQIENHLQQDAKAFVTTLIDYYGILPWHQFPAWDEAHRIVDKNARMTALENAMKEAIEESIAYRFIPYIQLHEFEGLLFNRMDVFNSQIPQEDFIDKELLAHTIENNPNPEMINDTQDNAPSYRLARLIKGYNKIVYGAILAQQIGLERIRAKSPRFNKWVSSLEALVIT